MPPKKIFKRSQNFEYFQNWRLKGSKILSFFKKGDLGGQKTKILKKYFQNWKGLRKLDTRHVPHATKKDFQKKVKILSIFKNGGLRGQKLKILKKYFKNRKGLKKLDIKHVPHSQKVQKKSG